MADSKSPLLEAALAYGARGWPVHPCSGKQPLLKDWPNAASCDEWVITDWWRQSPTANVGITTGFRSQIIVLDIDVDPEKGIDGEATLAALVARYGPLPETVEVRTGRGGRHLYYEDPGYFIKSGANVLGPGLDIRADGGQVIAPPSRHPNGNTYAWVPGHSHDEVDLAELPSWFPAALEERQSPPAAQGQPAIDGRRIPEGERNSTLASLAGSMRRRGMTEKEMRVALLVANAERLDPPLDEGEVASIAASVAGYEPAPAHEGYTDTGNAHRLIRLEQNAIRYCAEEKAWYGYDGRHWCRDEVLAVEDLVKKALLSIYEEAARCQDETQRKAAFAWAKRSESRASRRAALECARSDPRIAVRPTEFNPDGWLLNCPNGTLDLRSGRLRPHEPRDLITHLTGADYDSQARSELWERFLGEVTGGDQELLAYLQRAAGYSCTDDCAEEVYFVLLGETSTGKTTFTEAITRALGDYAVSVNQEALLARSNVGGTRDSIMRLDGRRLAVCAEFDRGRRFDESLVKQLVGGDTVTGRRIYEHERSFPMTAKLWLHTNHIPRLSDDDDASWRRLRILPFRHQPVIADPHVKTELCDAAVSGAAILTWLVEGCLAWQRERLGEAVAVTRESRTLRREMDLMGDFFDELCGFAAGAWTTSRALKLAYLHHADENGLPRELRVSPGKGMAGYLKRRGCVPLERHGVRGWSGIYLINSAEQDVFFPEEQS